ncbi:hypothetical protein HL667_27945 [Bradyrhizobium sp. 83012]|uniref:Uncharacterized protein n=1 Tax=Bradyrhizobium aeschynomenes TaxID=2734909 RepID=A0ABX2CLR5_9BRAD|nr:hypothetical protein [Bradyrhizobium aeschynomenes]NPU68863.1 hypothetical protein [Bradyrhizobium aeschynomenes]
MPTLHLLADMKTINDAGHFRDLFFGLVPASAVSLSTAFDFICVKARGEITGLLVVIALILNVVVLLSGVVGFLMIPPHSPPLSPAEFSAYSSMILAGLGFSLVTELWTSGAAHRSRGAGQPSPSLIVD